MDPACNRRVAFGWRRIRRGDFRQHHAHARAAKALARLVDRRRRLRRNHRSLRRVLSRTAKCSLRYICDPREPILPPAVNCGLLASCCATGFVGIDHRKIRRRITRRRRLFDHSDGLRASVGQPTRCSLERLGHSERPSQALLQSARDPSGLHSIRRIRLSAALTLRRPRLVTSAHIA